MYIISATELQGCCYFTNIHTNLKKPSTYLKWQTNCIKITHIWIHSSHFEFWDHFRKFAFISSLRFSPFSAVGPKSKVGWSNSNTLLSACITEHSLVWLCFALPTSSHSWVIIKWQYAPVRAGTRQYVLLRASTRQ